MFICANCHKEVSLDAWGTSHRNHCPYCLCSLHLDKEPGDRLSNCKGIMIAIALTQKIEGVDKYGRKREGEIMLVHLCQKCGHISINRLAGDDNEEKILQLVDSQVRLPSHIKPLTDKEKVKNLLLGTQLANED
jgi:hypothetical protein